MTSYASRLGKHQREALDFARRNDGWHTFDITVKRVILSLAARGLVEVSLKTNQFRAVTRYL